MPKGFCGSEVQISTDPCNSMYPAVTFDGSGNAFIVWHDNRSGNYEIWGRALASTSSPSNAVTTDLADAQGRPNDMSCLVGASGFAGFVGCTGASGATGSAAGASTGGVPLVKGKGTLDVNTSARSFTFSATGVDLKQAGVASGAIVTIIDGANANATFTVSQLAAASVAQLVYYDGPVSDTGFTYTISAASNAVVGSCEMRLTCNLSASLFPDVMGEATGRYDIVYQDNDGGNFHLYYVQAFPRSVGATPACQGVAQAGGFGSVPSGTPGSTPVTPGSSTTTPSNYIATGTVGQFFSYGDRLLPSPTPTGSGGTRRGEHRLYREFYPGAGTWTGISDAADLQAWRVQIRANSGSIVPTPDFVAPQGHPIAHPGDFGKRFSFTQLAFMAQSPPDAGVEVQTIALPIAPACAPDKSARVAAPREADLVGLPKLPAPPTFIDPVDLSRILSSPLVTLDTSSPSRFTIAGDSSGTIFTNVLVQNGQGDLTRLVFQSPDPNQPALKMVLGQYKCGDGPCAVSVPKGVGPVVLPSYGIKLQVWVGPSYIGNDGIASSARLTATKLLEKDFAFGPGDAINAFDFGRGELAVPSGHVLFFVATSTTPGTEFMVTALGGGNSVWTTLGDSGAFDNFSSPFTLPPYGGLSAPVYYDGLLSSVVSPGGSGSTTPTTTTADCSASLVLPTSLTIDCMTSNAADTTTVSPPPYVVPAVLKVGFIVDSDTNLKSVSLDFGAGGAGLTIVWSIFSDGDNLAPGQVLQPGAGGTFDATSFPAIAAGGVVECPICAPGLTPGNYIFQTGYGPAFHVRPTSDEIDANIYVPVSIDTIDGPASQVPRCILNFTNSALPTLATDAAPAATATTTADATAAAVAAAAAVEAAGSPTDIVATAPVRLTVGKGDDEHPRLGKDDRDNMWMVWHSKRTGSDEVYCARYYAECGVWNSSAFGGEDQRLTNFSADGGVAQFPNVAVDSKGEAHVVFQGTSPEDGRWEVYYTKSTGGKTAFLPPIRLTTSPADAMMPDVAVDKLNDAVVVVWHDNRFGNFEIMAATRTPNGEWSSSGQGGADTRISEAPFDSLFPRVAADTQGNIRVVWHDYRGGASNANAYMATFVASANRWDSSAQGGVDLKVSGSPGNALQPDIALDRGNGVMVAWQDDRTSLSDPSQHEEVFSIYCPRVDSATPCFPPIVTNVENRLDVGFKIVDCVDFQEISFTNVPEVCLRISAPNATFFRAANEDGAFSDWTQFKPSIDLNTTVVPWTLSCKAGQKQVCVQVQDSQLVGFPICQSVSLVVAPPTFNVQFFADEALTTPLPFFDGIPAASFGAVFVRITSQNALIEPPTFDVVSRGISIIMNQSTEVDSGASGFSGSSGIGSFVGTDVSGASGASGFKAAGNKTFKARFTVRRDDGLFHLDGFARLIPHGKDVCGNLF